MKTFYRTDGWCADNRLASWHMSMHQPGKWWVAFTHFAGFNDPSCYAVIDDFGNLVQVPA